MKISELISKLTELQEAHGDINCVTEYCENLWYLKCVILLEQREVNPFSFNTTVEDVVIIG
jgi:hypothetical protein